MAKIYLEKDIKIGLLKDKVIGIVSFGSQRHTHAQSSRASGCMVIVAETKGTQGQKNAEQSGFKPMDAIALTKDLAARYFLAKYNA